MTPLPCPRGSLRARLTAWHGAVLSLVLVTFALAVYGLFARSLLAEVDRSLIERAREVNRTVRWTAIPWRPRAVVIPPPDRFASADTFVQVTALDGTVLGRSDNLRDAALPVAPKTWPPCGPAAAASPWPAWMASRCACTAPPYAPAARWWP